MTEASRVRHGWGPRRTGCSLEVRPQTAAGIQQSRASELVAGPGRLSLGAGELRFGRGS